MKKILLIAFAAIIIFTACKKTETVQVEKTVMVTIKPTDAIDSAEIYLTKTNNGYGSKQDAPAIITGNLKTLINSTAGAGLNYFTVYAGDHRFDRNDIPGMAGYGNPSHIIVLCWYNSNLKQVRVYEYTGSRFEQNVNASITGDGLKPSADFAKNVYLGTITTSELLLRK